MFCDVKLVGSRLVCRRCGQDYPARFGTKIVAKCSRVNLGQKKLLARRRSSRGCIYLGEPTGEKETRSPCCGSPAAELDVLRCLHPNHTRTTIPACAACDDFSDGGGRPQMLLRFVHGFGDHIQLVPVLRHIRKLHPEWVIHLACHLGRDPGFVELGLADQVFYPDQHPPAGEYELFRNLFWVEPDRAYVDSASTKAERCLRDVFGIEPRPEWSHYEAVVAENYLATFKAMREDIGPYVVVHGTGLTSRRAKDLLPSQLDAIVDTATAHGRIVIILDMEQRLTPEQLPWSAERVTVWSERFWINKPAAIAALGAVADVAIGIDSGPAKLWDAAGARTMVVWRDLHPLHYHCPRRPCGAMHFIPDDHQQNILAKTAAEHAAALDFFFKHYLSTKVEWLGDLLGDILQKGNGAWVP